MQTVTQVTQSHLSVLVLDKDSHSPVVRMPIYAELSIVEETITGSGGIYLVDGSTTEEQEESGESSSSVSATVDLVDGSTSEGQDAPQEGLIQLHRDSSSLVGRAADMAVRSSERKAIYSYPLGYLATDHVGYASFDLTQVSSLIRSRNSNLIASEENGVRRSYAIFVYPMGKEGERFDVLEQGRFTEEAIFAKLSIEKPALVHDLRILNLPSMQKPSLIDWYFSPGSFTAHPEILVGENGCERLLPAQIALQEFNIRQVVRVVGASPVSLPADYKFAYVDDYRVTWHSLGHSLGEILYSLPLAPGESVKLAVIDWSWESTTQRTEQTVLTEEILHQTHRDRTISETVKAGLRELQRGSSFMGGVATSAGGSGSTGAIGVAIGNAWSLGGSTATSEGSRDLIAENVQRLNDSFSQASSSQRELSSTVVIQSRQEEKESIQTRTFTNYNHSHTLTILYYEVLRHFKVVVEWVRRRPAILVKYDQPEFDDKTLQIYRPFLEDNLLDPRLKLGFSALDKLRAMQTDDLVNPKAKPEEPLHPRKYAFTTFLFRFEVDEEETSDPVFVSARLADGTSIELKYKNNTNLNESDELFNNDGTYEIALLPTTSIEWGKLVGFDIWVGGDDNLQLNQVGFRGTGTFGSIVELRKFEGPALTFVDRDKRQTVTVNLPGPDLPTLPAPPTPAQRLSVDENAAIELLRNHTNQFKSYYHRLIALNRDPSEIYTKFESANWDATSKLIDHVEPYPLEAFGSYIAYPFVIPNNELPSLNLEGLKKYSEKLATLPTRGVFAEGKLGHCNISEEIDNTRFWKWEEHPIPFEAPSINPAMPITPQPQQTDSAPTAFPSSLVNIVNPSAAPDPTGLAAALTVLGTPNIFRDMSGQQEVADLLKKLSDNTISIAEASNRAKEIQRKYGGSGGIGASSGADSSSSLFKPSVGQGIGVGIPQTVGEVNDLASGIRNQLPPEQANMLVGQLYQNAVDKAGSAADGGLIKDPSQITGSLVPTSIAFPSGGQHLCFPVSEFQSSQFASGFGTIAERLIEQDYCETLGCSPATTYIDNNNPTAYKEFLVVHNPSLASGEQAVKLSGEFPKVKRPDIMSDDGSRKDYYEIKPLSISGSAAGVLKLTDIISFMNRMSLPYVPGTTYTPSKDIPMMSGTILGCKIGVSLNVQRFVPGIVTYTICLNGEVAALLGKALVAAILAWIAAQLLTLAAAGSILIA